MSLTSEKRVAYFGRGEIHIVYQARVTQGDGEVIEDIIEVNARTKNGDVSTDIYQALKEILEINDLNENETWIKLIQSAPYVVTRSSQNIVRGCPPSFFVGLV